MKGDGFIKKVLLKFIGTGLLDEYQAYVKVYDHNKVYYEGTTYNGRIELSLEENKAYSVNVLFFNKSIISAFYVSIQDVYVFNFDYSNYNHSHTVTFLLNDYYYKMPIMKGEIILGKNN